MSSSWFHFHLINFQFWYAECRSLQLMSGITIRQRRKSLHLSWTRSVREGIGKVHCTIRSKLTSPRLSLSRLNHSSNSSRRVKPQREIKWRINRLTVLLSLLKRFVLMWTSILLIHLQFIISMYRYLIQYCYHNGRIENEIVLHKQWSYM